MLCLQVAKSVSFRLCSELEAVQKKNSQLEWENEALREKTQELEVAKQVLQAEMEKAREVQHSNRTPPQNSKLLVQCSYSEETDLNADLLFIVDSGKGLEGTLYGV